MHRTNPVSRRRELASAVAAVYSTNPKVAAELLAGSVARNLTDEFSDIEVDVFWHEPPTDSDRRHPIAQGGWRSLSSDVDEHEWADSFSVDGINVDTSQFLVATIDDWIDRVVTQGDPEPEYQVRISAILFGEPLHNATLIERWRARTDAYPEALAHAMVRKGVALWPRARVGLLAERDGALLLHSDLVDNMQILLDMLMGLNRLYARIPGTSGWTGKPVSLLSPRSISTDGSERSWRQLRAQPLREPLRSWTRRSRSWSAICPALRSSTCEPRSTGFGSTYSGPAC